MAPISLHRRTELGRMGAWKEREEVSDDEDPCRGHGNKGSELFLYGRGNLV